MKSINANLFKSLFRLSRRFKKIFVSNVNSIKKDFAFYNNHTELLAIWTVLFMSITGLFIFAITSNILVKSLLFILAIAIVLTFAIAIIYYLHALKYHHQKRLLPRIHKFLNKSFKLRKLLSLVKFPHISIPNLIAKGFKLSS